MTLEALADAVLLPGFTGTAPPDWVRRRVAGGLGGVVLFARNCVSPAQLAELTAALRAERADVLVATDEEGGDVTRLFAAVGSPVPGTVRAGRGRRRRADPVGVGGAGRAGRRGRDRLDAGPGRGRQQRAGQPGDRRPLVRGDARAGRPARGRGGRRASSRPGSPPAPSTSPGTATRPSTRTSGWRRSARTSRGALEPFRAAVAAGVATVMTGHLLVPGYGDLPATLNPALVDGLLRAELGFDGVVVSDALEMGAIAGSVGVGEGAVLAVLAGVDALCLGGDEAGEPIADAARDALVAAVRCGRLAEERLAAAAARVRALAGRFPVDRLDVLGLAAARRGVRWGGDVRLGSGAPVLVRLDPAPTIAVGRTAWGLDGLLRGASELVVGPDDPLPAVPAGRPLVVVARDATRVGWVGRAVAGLLAARPDAVVVEMGLPGPVPPARGWIATGGASAASARAAAELLLGSTP